MLRTIPTVDPTRFMASLCLERKRYRKSSHTSSPNLMNPTFSFLQRSNSSTTSQSNEAKSAQPQTLEELLERQWEQGSQFLMEQASHFDSKLTLNFSSGKVQIFNYFFLHSSCFIAFVITSTQRRKCRFKRLCGSLCATQRSFTCRQSQTHGLK